MSYTFTAAPSVATAAGPVAVIASDVNGDGKLDLLTANREGASYSVRIGTGDGSFTDGGSFGTIRLRSLATVDLNGDGKLDLLTQRDSVGMDIAIGAGNGIFTGVFSQGYPGTPSNSAFVTADVNGDGKTDMLVVRVQTNSAVAVRFGQGDGTFTATATSPADTPTGRNPSALTTTDLNRDGRLDLLVANQDDNTVSVRLGNGNGTFAATDNVLTGASPVSVASADLNGDGKADLLVANRQSNTVSVRLGMGDGRFTSAADVAVGTAPSSITAADMNHDGRIDLVVANSGDDTVSVHYGLGDGGFSDPTRFAVGDEPTSVTTADVNGDGRSDLLVSNHGSASVSVLLGADRVVPVGVLSQAGSGSPRKIGDVVTFTLLTDAPIAASGSQTLSLSNGGQATYAGQDAQGRLQFSYTVAEGQDSSDLRVTGLAGNGGSFERTSFAAKRDVAIGTNLNGIAVADLNGDGRLDLAAANGGSANVSVLLGGVDGSFGTKQDFATAASPSAAALADLNGDGRFDLVTPNTGSSTVSVLLGNTDGSFQTKQDLTIGGLATAVSLADMNGDGKTDIVAASNDRFVVSVLLGNGDGTFQDKKDVGTTAPSSVTLADVNRDGKLDLVTSNNSGNFVTATVSVNLGKGDGTFQPRQAFATASPTSDVSVADLNADGKLDLIAANATANSVSVLLGNGDGSFQNKRDFATGASPSSVATADLNGDGKLDLVTANKVDNTVSVLLGNGDGTLQAKFDLATGSQPSDVTIVDMNKDGKPDLVTANGDGTASILLNTSITPKTFDAANLANVPGADTSREIDATRPALQSAFATGTTLTLTYSEALDAASGHAPDPSAFAVTTEGTVVGVTGVTVSGRTVTLTLATPVTDGHGLEVAYADLTNGDDANAIQDAAGNDALAASRTIVVGTPAPTGLAIAAADDTGASSSDGLTSKTSLTVSGGGTSGAIVFLFDDADGDGRRDDGEDLVGSDTVASDGRFSTVINLHGDGLHRIVAAQSGPGGISPGSAALAVALDTNAPGLSAALRNDTGTFGDARTSDAGLSVAAEGGATIGYRIDGAVTFSSSYDPSGLADGAHSVVVRATDAAGNAAERTITFTLDRVGPIVTAVTTAAPGLSNGTGTLTIGQTVTLTLALSEGVGLAGANNLVIGLSDGSFAAFDANASDATHLAFRHTVEADQTASDLAVTAIGLTGTTLRDAAGNAANLSGAVGNPVGTLVIDGYTGSTGDDIFSGTAGAETFRGRGGDDTYTVNNAGDVVIEAAGQGDDTVMASVSFALAGQNVEDLRLTGSAAIAGTGNGLANMLFGNTAANRLDGGAGADVLIGSKGNDVYVVDSALDQVVESAGSGYGSDTILSSVSVLRLADNVEALTLTGAGNLTAAGNALANTIAGNTGANTLDGGLGSDVLTGGAGKDTFFFSTKPASSNLDHVTDFRAVDDTIQLENAVFTALNKTGTLSSNAFATIASASATVSADAHILYEKAGGTLYYDPNGGSSAGRIAFAVIDNQASLTFQDFAVV